jgi:hypothetical protein
MTLFIFGVSLIDTHFLHRVQQKFMSGYRITNNLGTDLLGVHLFASTALRDGFAFCQRMSESAA